MKKLFFALVLAAMFAMPAAHRKLADKLFAGPDAHAAQQTTLPASDQE